MMIYCLRSLGTSVILGASGKITIDLANELYDDESIVSVIEGDSNPQLFIPNLIDY